LWEEQPWPGVGREQSAWWGRLERAGVGLNRSILANHHIPSVPSTPRPRKAAPETERPRLEQLLEEAEDVPGDDTVCRGEPPKHLVHELLNEKLQLGGHVLLAVVDVRVPAACDFGGWLCVVVLLRMFGLSASRMQVVRKCAGSGNQ
jgi:hypothetical protein